MQYNFKESFDKTGFGGHVKWVAKQIKKGESSGGMTQFNPSVHAKVNNFVNLTAIVPAVLRSTQRFPHAHAAMESVLTCVQCFSVSVTCTSLNQIPYAIGEVRVLVQGNYLLAGMPFASVSGVTLAETFKHMTSFSGAAEFVNQAMSGHDEGFCLLHEVGMMIYIPPNFVVATLGLHNNKDKEISLGLRWGIVPTDKTSLKAAAGTVDAMCKTFPGLDGSDYSEWRKLLTILSA